MSVAATVALALSVVLGIPLGVLAALRRNALPDVLTAFVSVLGLSVPAFWLGIVLILAFSVSLNLIFDFFVSLFATEGKIWS